MQSRSEGKKRLPLAKASSGTLSLADAAAVGKLFKISTTVEAANYFQQQFKQQVVGMGLTKDFEKVLDEIDRFVSIIHDSASNYCFGDEAKSAFMTYQNKLSDAAAKALGESETKIINFDFKINSTSDLVQGFVADNGDSLDEFAEKQLNNIYSDWLTKNKMVCNDGVIYEGKDDNGVFKGDVETDTDGSNRRVDPVKYRDLFMGRIEDKKGFAAFVKEKTTLQDKTHSGIDVNVTDWSEEKDLTQQMQS